MRKEERINEFQLSLREALEELQSKMWTSLPGEITSVNFVNQTVEVQPTIQAILYDKGFEKQNVTLPVLINVPIVWPRGGGFTLTFPLKVGDEVLVDFSSRSIDSWWQSSGVGAQVENRMHDLSDGFAIVGTSSVPKALANVSENSVQLRSDDGNNYFEISETGKIAITSTVEIELNAPIITINASAVAAINAPVIELNGPTEITGGITIDGNDYTAHQHSGVEPGVGITGGVV